MTLAIAVHGIVFPVPQRTVYEYQQHIYYRSHAYYFSRTGTSAMATAAADFVFVFNNCCIKQMLKLPVAITYVGAVSSLGVLEGLIPFH